MSKKGPGLVLISYPDSGKIDHNIYTPLHTAASIHIGVNRPDLGGTVLNSTAVSRCPALLAFNPDFTKLLTV